MSGFDSGWLDLREPADHAARDRGLLLAAAGGLAALSAPTLVDLGSGTGSSVRAFGAALPDAARWRLVDNDPILLALAGRRLSSAVATVEADLTDVAGLPLEGADLMTASALFDLVSQDWLDVFAAALASRRLPLYAALSYDGRIQFADVHEVDEAVVEAFNAHQGGDKGFGPALGPASPAALRRTFEAFDYAVEEADSPWRLGPGPLRDAFLDGVAGAVAETGRVEAARLAGWLAARRDSAAPAIVGHRDILARPRG